MDTQQLIDYLKMVLDVEETIYVRNELIQELEERKEIEKPEPPYLFEINYPRKPVSRALKKAEDEFTKIKNRIADLKEQVRRKERGLGGFFRSTTQEKREIQQLESTLKTAEREYTYEFNAYSRALSSYESDLDWTYKHDKENEKALEEYNVKNDRFTKIQEPYYDTQIQELKQANKKSQENLNAIYNQGIIYPAYRNIVAVSAIIEYLESGRCSSLEGDYGAYNKFDLEFNFNQIIQNQKEQISLLRQLLLTNSQIVNQIFTLRQAVSESQREISKTLDSISSSVNRIIENQDRMEAGVAQGIRNIANSQDRISQSLNAQSQRMDGQANLLRQIKVNSDISAYNQERSRKELEYLRRMDDLEKGRWINY